MHTNLIIGLWPAFLLAGTTLAALMLAAYPLWKRYPDDRGDGNSVVLIPPPKLPPLWRAPVFLLIFVAIVLVIQGIQGPLNPNQLYERAVINITDHVVRAPSEINGSVNNFVIGLRFLVAGSIVSLAIVGRGTLARRLTMLLSAGIYLLLMVLVDSCLEVIQVVFGLPVGPGTLVGTFVVIGFGFLGMTRMMFVTYCLPRPSTVPFKPRPRSSDALTLIVFTLVGMAVAAVLVAYVYRLADANLKPLLPVLLPIPFAQVTLMVRAGLFLILSKVAVAPEPPVGLIRAPIDVIIPAYNEEAVIVDTLKSVDAAAGRHGGPVRVIICNDGSTDRTRELILETIAKFQYADGHMIEGRHGGKSATLNACLAETTTDIVVRIDADTLVHEWSLYYVQRWFDDPEIGLVEAMMWPRWNSSIFPRFRLFEELRQFGFNHRLLQQVDAVNVVPGVFTAFRRDVAMELNGFTVGMNGEDGDFTLRFSRKGYRTVMDPKIIIYEDVPATYLEIREQRIRWGRGMVHNHSRHGPYRAGLGTPKVWFSQAHLFYAKTFRPLRLMFLFYILTVAIFEGAYRRPILTFLLAYTVAIFAVVATGVLLAVVYGHFRRIGWALAFPVWVIITEFFSVESWLSLPGRPVQYVDYDTREREMVPVIH